MVDVMPLCGGLGAEVLGVDLAESLDDATGKAIETAFREHVVLVFRGQNLSPARQTEFTERFGPVQPHPLRTRRTVPGHLGVLILENRPGRPGARNDYWHSDISHAECPPASTFLYALEVPQGRGDTMFCNMYRAFDGLSECFRETLSSLKAVHSPMATLRRNNAEKTDALPLDEASLPQAHVHPVVRTHPVSKRQALFVNPHFTTHIEGMTNEESAPLLAMLYAQATRPENVYRHRWAAGDLVMWDNRAAMHFAVRDYDDSVVRYLHRTTAAGERPV